MKENGFTRVSDDVYVQLTQFQKGTMAGVVNLIKKKKTKKGKKNQKPEAACLAQCIYWPTFSMHFIIHAAVCLCVLLNYV